MQAKLTKEHINDDLETASEDADTSDDRMYQFAAKDEAFDPMSSDDSEADAAQNNADRSRILSTQNTFSSEDEPSRDHQQEF